MRLTPRTSVLLGSCLAHLCAAQSKTWERVLLTAAANATGAVCIDGSPGALYFKAGIPPDDHKFILFWEGGGWCMSAEDCKERASTALGSSKTYASTSTAYSERDILNPNCKTNPNFCKYSSVYAPYCDGASRAGDATDPIEVGGKKLYYRGARILRATIDAMLSPPAGSAINISLATATELLISGSSAGGLTTYLHADYIADRVRAVVPGISVKAIPEVGFFLDAVSIWGTRIMTDVMSRIAAPDFANVTGAVNADCVAATPPDRVWQCFFAQYTYPHIRTPTFVLNSVVDEYQTQHILAPDPNTTVTVNPYKPFASCILHPQSDCNATQFAQWQNYSVQFMGALNASLAATPPASLQQNGGVITSCPIHTTAISGISHKIIIRGRSMYDRLSDWYFQRNGTGGDASVYWTYDEPWPGDKTCPAPSDVPAEWAFL